MGLALAKIQPKANGILMFFEILYRCFCTYVVSHSHVMRLAIREAVATHGHLTSIYAFGVFTVIYMHICLYCILKCKD
jgi:hypothetical protein